jgi:hypothetical protein
MSNAVNEYLYRFPHHHEFYENWPLQGEMRVRLSIGNCLPPLQASSSILAIVFDLKSQIVFLAPEQMSGNISHLLIGGRPENGEIPEDTIRREVGEETGWMVEPIKMVGFRHFQHLGPNVEGNDRPYPDFIQPIYAARTLYHNKDLIRGTDFISWKLLEYGEVEKVTEPGGRILLQAAAVAVHGCKDS